MARWRDEGKEIMAQVKAPRAAFRGVLKHAKEIKNLFNSTNDTAKYHRRQLTELEKDQADQLADLRKMCTWLNQETDDPSEDYFVILGVDPEPPPAP